MNEAGFYKLSMDLRNLARKIPLHWGQVQNNKVDDKINMFDIFHYEELEKQIASLPITSQKYLRRRWYLWKCSECDEYLFYCNDNVEKNPNKYDKEYDVKINNRYHFDIKGTVVPREMRDNIEILLENPQEMINFYYDRQSTGRRYDIQNRLFVVHHSFVEPQREFYLRCAWKSKRAIYKYFCEIVEDIEFYQTHGVFAGVIFILERERGKVEFKICGLKR